MMVLKFKCDDYVLKIYYFYLFIIIGILVGDFCENLAVNLINFLF